LTVKLFASNGEDRTKLMEFLDNFRKTFNKYHDVQFIPIEQDDISKLAERDIVVGYYFAYSPRLEQSPEWVEITKKCSNCLIVAWRPGSSVDNMSQFESSTFPSGINLKTEKPILAIIEICRDVGLHHTRNKNNVEKLFSLIYEVAGLKINNKEKKQQKKRDKKENETESSMTEHSVEFTNNNNSMNNQHEPSKTPCGNEECYRKLVCCVKSMDHDFHPCRKHEPHDCNFIKLNWPRQCVLCTKELDFSCQMCQNCSKQFCTACTKQIH